MALAAIRRLSVDLNSDTCDGTSTGNLIPKNDCPYSAGISYSW
jgi:hypothetical protein